MNKNIFLTLLVSVGFVNLETGYGTVGDEEREYAVRTDNAEDGHFKEATEDEALPILYKNRFEENDQKSWYFRQGVEALLSEGKESEAQFEIANWIIKWRPGVVIPFPGFSQNALQRIEAIFRNNYVNIEVLLQGIDGFNKYKEIENDLYGIMLEEIKTRMENLLIGNSFEITFPSIQMQKRLLDNKDFYMQKFSFTKEFIRQCFNNHQSLLLLDMVPENLIEFLENRTEKGREEVEHVCQQIICGQIEIPEDWMPITQEIFDETLRTLERRLAECLEEQKLIRMQKEQDRIMREEQERGLRLERQMKEIEDFMNEAENRMSSAEEEERMELLKMVRLRLEEWMKRVEEQEQMKLPEGMKSRLEERMRGLEEQGRMRREEEWMRREEEQEWIEHIINQTPFFS